MSHDFADHRPSAVVAAVFGLALAALLAFGPARAGEPAEDFLLGAGDTLRISVFDLPALSGEATIGPDGAVVWPLIGAVPAAGLSLGEVRAAVVAAVGRVLDHVPAVSVQIVGYRPIFVVGAVANPGEHAFMPGLSVLQGYAKAGGPPSLNSLPLTVATEAVRARQSLRSALAQEQTQLLRRAQLEAALAGEAHLSLPEHLVTGAPGSEMAAQVERRSDLLSAELPLLQVSRLSHQEHDTLLGAEIEALTNEGDAIQAQLASVSDEVGRMKALHREGLTTNARLLSLRQIEAGLQADRYRRDAALSRARRDRVRERLRMREEEAEWRQTRLESLAELEAALAQTRIEIAAARDRLSALGPAGAATAGGSQDGAQAQPVFMVSRRTPSGTLVTTVAEPGDLLQPGDVMQVAVETPIEQALHTPTALGRE